MERTYHASSVADLLLMTHYHNSDRLTIKAIARDIAAIAKVDGPLPVRLCHAFNGSTDLRLEPKHLHGLDDGLACSFGRCRVFWPQKLPQSLKVPDRTGGVPYLWHSGALCSLSVPQLASHVCTSVSVACKPVSWYSCHALSVS